MLQVGNIAGKLDTTYGIPLASVPFKAPGEDEDLPDGVEDGTLYRVLDAGVIRMHGGTRVLVGVSLEILPADFYSGDRAPTNVEPPTGPPAEKRTARKAARPSTRKPR